MWLYLICPFSSQWKFFSFLQLLLWVSNQGVRFPGHAICIYLTSQDNTTFYCRMLSQKFTIPSDVRDLTESHLFYNLISSRLLLCQRNRCKYYLTVFSISICEISIHAFWPFFSLVLIFLIYFRSSSCILYTSPLWVIHLAKTFLSSWLF